MRFATAIQFSQNRHSSLFPAEEGSHATTGPLPLWCFRAPTEFEPAYVSLTKRAFVPTSIEGLAGGERIELSEQGFGDLAVPSTPPI